MAAEQLRNVKLLKGWFTSRHWRKFRITEVNYLTQFRRCNGRLLKNTEKKKFAAIGAPVMKLK
jgi:hypothetical protein